jgi:thiol-disulfide isomerase/thioredoxin
MKKIVILFSLIIPVIFSIGCKKKRVKAPTFKLKGISGGFCDLKKAEGKVVLLEFWRYNCPYCRRMAPQLKYVANNTNPMNVQIMAIHSQTNNPSVHKFIREKYTVEKVIHNSIKNCLDNGVVGKQYTKDLPDGYKVNGVPHIMLIDKDGYIVKVYSGYTKGNIMLDDIKDLSKDNVISKDKKPSKKKL